jgi:hypothetical protein
MSSAGKPPDANPSPGFRSRISAVIVALLPSKFQQIVEKGLLSVLISLVLALVVAPPLIVLLTAFWMSLLGKIDNPAVGALRNAYLEVLHQGFTIEEVASRSNARLDYLQTFAYDLKPKVSPSRVLQISIQHGQKVAIDFRVVAFKADKPTCSLPEDDIDLVSVALGSGRVGSLKRDTRRTLTIGAPWWKRHGEDVDPEDQSPDLSFSLTEQARELTCGQLHIEGSVRVYKDLFAVLERGVNPQ